MIRREPGTGQVFISTGGCEDAVDEQNGGRNIPRLSCTLTNEVLISSATFFLFHRAAMRLVSFAGGRLRRAAEEEEEKERPVPPPPSHRSNHQFESMKNKFFNELTHLPSEHTLTTHLLHTYLHICCFLHPSPSITFMLRITQTRHHLTLLSSHVPLSCLVLFPSPLSFLHVTTLLGSSRP